MAGLPTVNLPALADALTDYNADDGRDRFFVRREILVLERRLQQREQELATALDHIAALEAALQGMSAFLSNFVFQLSPSKRPGF